MTDFDGMTQALRDVQDERARQISREGWKPEHDDQHTDGALAMAGASYALRTMTYDEDSTTQLVLRLRPPSFWPFASHWWKPTTRRRDLVKAAALLLAEIERLDRQEARK